MILKICTAKSNVFFYYWQSLVCVFLLRKLSIRPVLPSPVTVTGLTSAVVPVTVTEAGNLRLSVTIAPVTSHVKTLGVTVFGERRKGSPMTAKQGFIPEGLPRSTGRPGSGRRGRQWVHRPHILTAADLSCPEP